MVDAEQQVRETTKAEAIECAIREYSRAADAEWFKEGRPLAANMSQEIVDLWFSAFRAGWRTAIEYREPVLPTNEPNEKETP